MTIGILGGTFDPIHIGHLILAQEVGQQLHCSQVIFVPANIPPHKNDTTTPTHRYNMVQLATQNNPFFSVSRVELDRPEISYTIETMRILKTQYKEPLAFIIGADNLLDLPKWHCWQSLLEICEFAIGSRLGFDLSMIDQLLPLVGADQCRKFKQNCVAIPNINISSSEIRNRYLHHQSVKYWIPDLVDEYIRKYHLYTTG